ncbi:MAG: hypothetical protein HY608_02785 [Planctomycetes bacterium]|nr:hypothetical protein [Planctomycetota bacterium]
MPNNIGARRGIAHDLMLRIAESPEQVVSVRAGREIRQSRIPTGEPGKWHLVRLIVDFGEGGAVVVTAYRTSRIGKYWRSE